MPIMHAPNGPVGIRVGHSDTEATSCELISCTFRRGSAHFVNRSATVMPLSNSHTQKTCFHTDFMMTEPFYLEITKSRSLSINHGAAYFRIEGRET